MDNKQQIFKQWSNAFCKAIKPKPKLTGSEWADLYRVIPPGTSPEPGKWNTNRVPYLKSIVDEATNDITQEVVVMSASQIGKSELLLNTIGFFMHQEPSPILLLQPTVEMAEAFSKERIDPMIQYTKELKECMVLTQDHNKQVSAEQKSAKKTSNTILKKAFIGGYLALVGSNAPAGLASRPIRVLLMDEVDRYGDTKEGDPVKLATQRTRNFHNRKIVQVSTPTFPDIKIHAAFERSDKREFYIPCPKCHQEVLLEWSLVEWSYDIDDNLDVNSIHIDCPYCGQRLRDHGRINIELLKQGKWVATAQSEIAGFHLNALYSPWTPLEDLVREYLSIKRGLSKKGMQEFYNLQLGLPFNPYLGQSELWKKLCNQTEQYPAQGIPNQCLVITAGVDIQRDRIEASFYGWGAYFEAWLLDHLVIKGDPKLPKVWNDLLAVITQMSTLKTDKGRKCPLCQVFIDSGDGYSTTEVYRFASQRPELFCAIKGQSSTIANSTPFVDKLKQKEIEAGASCSFRIIGVDAGKHIVMNALNKGKFDAGCIHFPKKTSIADNYFKQLTAEVFDQKLGKWIKVRKRNEALDCAVYARAAIESLGVDLVAVAKAMNV